MNIVKFRKLIRNLQGLSDKQRLEVESALHQGSPSESIFHLLEERLVEHPECPHCHSLLIIRHGKTQDRRAIHLAAPMSICSDVKILTTVAGWCRLPK